MSGARDKITLKLVQQRAWKCTDAELVRIVRAHARACPEVLDDFLALGARDAMRRWKSPEQREAIAKRQCEKGASQRSRRRADLEYASAQGIPLAEVSSDRAKRLFRAANEIMNSEIAKRAVELLDRWIVGGKHLGDCTKADLIKAERQARELATELKSHATELLTQAEIYKRLHILLSADETLRETNQRRDVVRILADYQEDRA